MNKLHESLVKDEAAQSLRFLIRAGELAQSARLHEDDLSDRREPDELFEPILLIADRSHADRRP